MVCIQLLSLPREWEGAQLGVLIFRCMVQISQLQLQIANLQLECFRERKAIAHESETID